MDEATHDELAGVVDLFGALTRAELSQALRELAFRRGDDVTDAAIAETIDEAVAAYYLVEVEREKTRGGEGDRGEDGRCRDAGERLLVPGPVAFPALPEDAEDLPYILDVPARSVDRDALVDDVAERLRGDAARAVDAGDPQRIRHLLDATYDLEAWGDVDLAEVRAHLDEAL